MDCVHKIAIMKILYMRSILVRLLLESLLLRREFRLTCNAGKKGKRMKKKALARVEDVVGERRSVGHDGHYGRILM